jgi:hypothetical protein
MQQTIRYDPPQYTAFITYKRGGEDERQAVWL